MATLTAPQKAAIKAAAPAEPSVAATNAEAVNITPEVAGQIMRG